MTWEVVAIAVIGLAALRVIRINQHLRELDDIKRRLAELKRSNRP